MSNMEQEEKMVLVDIKDRVAYITMNRPEKRNALNYSMVAELKNALKQVDQEPDLKVIVLRGNGKAFCAGADLEYLKKLQSYSFEENHADSTHLMELFHLIYRNRRIVIAQIEGHAIAGGSGLATVCDFAFAVPEAKFGYTEVKIGFIPAIVMYFLIRKVGETRAKELLLTGDIIDAAHAREVNMINDVVAADKIAEHVDAFAQRLCKENSGASMEFTKKMMGDIQVFPVDNALQFAAKMNAHARATDDCKKGIAAFLNKEKIEW